MDISSVIKTVAPWIGTALGGPLGGMAVEAATQALGLSDKTADGLKTALAGASSADILALKQADQSFQATMQTIGYKQIADLESIAAGDRASARDMQKAVKSWVPATLSVIITSGFFGLLIGTMAHWLTLDDSQALLLMLGSLTTGFGVVMSYWFGSTSNSFAKSQMLAASTPTK